jgi:hypothetical protein
MANRVGRIMSCHELSELEGSRFRHLSVNYESDLLRAFMAVLDNFFNSFSIFFNSFLCLGRGGFHSEGAAGRTDRFPGERQFGTQGASAWLALGGKRAPGLEIFCGWSARYLP